VFHLMAAAPSSEEHKTHLNLHSFGAVGTAAFCASFMMSSFVLALNSVFYSCFISCLSLSLSRSPFISPSCIPLSSPPFPLPPLRHLPSRLLMFSPSPLVSPLGPGIACRSPTTRTKSGGRWVINHLATFVRVHNGYLRQQKCVCACIYCPHV